MATCYICGKSHAEYRRTVSTGTSYRTSYTRKGPRVHTYDNYGERCVCAKCALNVDYKNKKISILFIMSMTFSPVGLLFSFMKFGDFFTNYSSQIILGSVIFLAAGIGGLVYKRKVADKWYEENKGKYVDTTDVNGLNSVASQFKFALASDLDNLFDKINKVQNNVNYCLNNSNNINDFNLTQKTCDEIIAAIDSFVSQANIKYEEIINHIVSNYSESDAQTDCINNCKTAIQDGNSKLIEAKNTIGNLKEKLLERSNSLTENCSSNELSVISTIESNTTALSEQNKRTVNAFNKFFEQIQPRIIEMDNITKGNNAEIYKEFTNACNAYGFKNCSIFDIMMFDLFASIILMRYKSCVESATHGINIVDKVLCYCPNMNLQPLVNRINNESKKNTVNVVPNVLNVLIEMVKKSQEIKPIEDGLSKDGYALVIYDYLKIMKSIAKDFFETGAVKPSTEEIMNCEKFFKTMPTLIKNELAGKTVTATPEKKNKVEQKVNSKEKTLEKSLEELNSLIGLEKVKEEVSNLVNLVKVRKMREEKGLKQVPLSLHLVFSGNPGTGKTTVARIIANIYKQLGILSEGQLIETDRSGLVAGYVGQTAIKTQEVIQKATGGILFIDEAYSLTSSKSDNDFGLEAVDTILKAMEDMRNDFVVIVAGYPELMKDFLKTNPGLESRFNTFIDFADYTPTELYKIFEEICKKKQLHI